MALRKNDAFANWQAASFNSSFQGGSLHIYTGTQPATGDTAATGTLLATITLPTPCMGTPASGVAAKSGTWSATAVASGTAGWARFVSSSGDRRVDGTVAEADADFIIDDAAVVEGGVVTITTYTWATPKAA